jgi:hypothetical protein
MEFDMEYTQDDLITAMYQNDEPETTSPEQTHIEQSGFARTRNIWVGAIKYEVPTMEYLGRLEQMIAAQARIISGQSRELTRLNHFMVATRNFIRRQTNHITELRTGLDQKIDQRDAF